MPTESKTFFAKFITLCVMSEWMEFTDGCISGGTSGGGGQVITTWSHSRPAKRGKHTMYRAYSQPYVATLKMVIKGEIFNHGSHGFHVSL